MTPLIEGVQRREMRIWLTKRIGMSSNMNKSLW
jgi:hypothetical protein